MKQNIKNIKMAAFKINGNIVNIPERKINFGCLHISDGKIGKVEIIGNENKEEPYIIPGLIDSHVHIESSMLVPSEFAKIAVVHGSTASISDPHEIANVCGKAGVEYMIDNGKTVPFKFHFGVPSCVPATIFETAGASLDAREVEELLQRSDLFYLSEMMNFPGVLQSDAEVLAKIAAAKKLGKPVDGHAPGLRGAEAKKYIEAGCSTDHECFTEEEASEKLNFGMKILIREGSAAKNFEALIPLMNEQYQNMMFCSDDKHPDSLVAGHINQLCARAVAKGIDVFKVLTAACINPVQHYKMNCGLLKEGDTADLVILKDLKNFEVIKTFIDGELVAENGKSLIKTQKAAIINEFNCNPKTVSDFKLEAGFKGAEVLIIEALDGQLITNKINGKAKIENGNLVSNTDTDTLKIVVVNRYYDALVAIGFIKNFRLKKGAIASTVAHDSHNIIAVGVTDEEICEAVNEIIQSKGGISAVIHNTNEKIKKSIALPVAGLMSNEDGYAVAQAYTEIDQFVKEELGSTLAAPFMTLSFMALLVIPKLKLSDKGLFDGESFSFVSN